MLIEWDNVECCHISVGLIIHMYNDSGGTYIDFS